MIHTEKFEGAGCVYLLPDGSEFLAYGWADHYVGADTWMDAAKAGHQVSLEYSLRGWKALVDEVNEVIYGRRVNGDMELWHIDEIEIRKDLVEWEL